MTNWKLLERNSLHFHGLQRVETIELANTVRHWKVYTHGAAPPSTEPFHVSAEIGFAWSPFDAARSYAREEDLCLAKTSYTCKMNDLAQSSIRTFPI